MAALGSTVHLGYVGPIEVRRGVLVLLSAIVGRADMRLTMAGSGADVPRVVEHAADLGLGERVRLVGALDRPALEALYRSLDLLVVPSLPTAGPVVATEAGPGGAGASPGAGTGATVAGTGATVAGTGATVAGTGATVAGTGATVAGTGAGPEAAGPGTGPGGAGAGADPGVAAAGSGTGPGAAGAGADLGVAAAGPGTGAGTGAGPGASMVARAVTDAVAAGVPVVASDEALAPVIGHAGVVVRPGDAVALRAALLRLADDPAERRRLADAARAIPRDR